MVRVGVVGFTPALKGGILALKKDRLRSSVSNPNTSSLNAMASGQSSNREHTRHQRFPRVPDCCRSEGSKMFFCVSAVDAACESTTRSYIRRIAFDRARTSTLVWKIAIASRMYRRPRRLPRGLTPGCVHCTCSVWSQILFAIQLRCTRSRAVSMCSSLTGATSFCSASSTPTRSRLSACRAFPMSCVVSAATFAISDVSHAPSTKARSARCSRIVRSSAGSDGLKTDRTLSHSSPPPPHRVKCSFRD